MFKNYKDRKEKDNYRHSHDQHNSFYDEDERRDGKRKKATAGD